MSNEYLFSSNAELCNVTMTGTATARELNVAQLAITTMGTIYNAQASNLYVKNASVSTLSNNYLFSSNATFSNVTMTGNVVLQQPMSMETLRCSTCTAVTINTSNTIASNITASNITASNIHIIDQMNIDAPANFNQIATFHKLVNFLSNITFNASVTMNDALLNGMTTILNAMTCNLVVTGSEKHCTDAFFESNAAVNGVLRCSRIGIGPSNSLVVIV